MHSRWIVMLSAVAALGACSNGSEYGSDTTGMPSDSAAGSMNPNGISPGSTPGVSTPPGVVPGSTTIDTMRRDSLVPDTSRTRP
jgi:hypothetical protein